MAWTVKYTKVFSGWFKEQDATAKADIGAKLKLLAEFGPDLKRPNADNVHGSNHGAMRELIINSDGRPYRVLYAFDKTRTGIVLLGGDKSGPKRKFDRMVDAADKLYSQHLEDLKNLELPKVKGKK